MAGLTDADRARMRQIIETDWVDATLARDWGASMALCTEDFAYMPQDHPLLKGREEAAAFLDAFPTIVSFNQSLDAATGDSGLAALRGSFDLTFQAEGQEVSGSGKFLATATKVGEEWLMSAACFNWDAPPSG